MTICFLAKEFFKYINNISNTQTEPIQSIGVKIANGGSWQDLFLRSNQTIERNGAFTVRQDHERIDVDTIENCFILDRKY